VSDSREVLCAPSMTKAEETSLITNIYRKSAFGWPPSTGNAELCREKCKDIDIFFSEACAQQSRLFQMKLLKEPDSGQ
jgi:hypothetical protein